METFKKRQKEMLRLEKQREKAARRLTKVKGKLEDAATAVYIPLDENGDPIIDEGDAAEPQPHASE
jgi:hypothetical protein